MRPLALGLVLLGACGELDDAPSSSGTADEVVTDWDRSVDFTQYLTYGFVESSEDGAPDSVGLNVTRVRNSMRREYEALGMTEEPDPDLEVTILTYSEEASSLELDCVSAGYWWGTTGGYDSCAFLELSRTDVTIGTILVGMADAQRREIVFNAAMQGVADGQNIESRIDRAVTRVFDDYPADQTGL